MTKKSKLLSLIVSAVLCFVCAGALCFSAGSAKAVVTPVVDSSEVVGVDYGVTNQKWVWNNTPTTNEWIIFEWTNGADNTVGSPAGASFYYNMAADTSNYASDAGLNPSWTNNTMFDYTTNSGVVKLYFNTKTGEHFYTHNDGEQVALGGDITANANGDAGTTPLYAGWLFNFDDGFDIKVYDFKCYDGAGTDLGIKTNMAELLEVEVPVGVTTISSFEKNSSFMIGNNLPTMAEWIILEWTNSTTNVIDGSVANGGFYAWINTTGAIYHEGHVAQGQVGIFTNYPYHAIMADGSSYSEAFTTRLAFNTIKGIAKYSINGGMWNLFLNPLDGGNEEYLGVNGNDGNNYNGGYYAGWCANTGVSHVEFSNIRSYDSDGNDLGVRLDNKEVAPEVDSSTVVPVELVSDLTLFGFYTKEKVTSDWIFFEWTNGENMVRPTDIDGGGYNLSLLAGNDDSFLTSPDAHQASQHYRALTHNRDGGFGKIFGSGNSVIIAFNLANGGSCTVKIKEPSAADFVSMNVLWTADEFASCAGDINNGQFQVGLWSNATTTASNGFTANGFKCYDENGKNVSIETFDLSYTPKTVTFMNGAAEFKKYTNAFPGNDFTQFADLGTPSGENFLGWTWTSGGSDLISDYDAVPAEGTTVYARFASTRESDISAFVGVYTNELGYIEITSDGNCISYFDNLIPNGSFTLFTDGPDKFLKFDGLSGLSSAAGSFTANGKTYTKVTDYKTVSYYAEDNIFVSLKVPTGFKAVKNIEKHKLAHTFNGWYAGSSLFNFNTVITDDVRLDARFTLNECAAAKYSAYTYSFFCASENALYNVLANKTYVKIINGVKTEGEYKLAFDGEKDYILFDGDVNNPYEIDAASIILSGKSYIKLLVSGYNIHVVYDNGKEEEDFEIDSESNYVFDIEEPTREGYTFKGWYHGDGSEYVVGSIVNHSFTIYAKWEKIGGTEAKGGGLSPIVWVVIGIAAVILAAGATFVIITLKKKKVN